MLHIPYKNINVLKIKKKIFEIITAIYTSV